MDSHRPQGLRRGIRGLLLVAALGLAFYAVAQDAQGFLDAVGNVGPGRSAIALILVVTGLLASGEAWRLSIRAVAGPIGPRSARRLFFVTQLGKYLPGAVWTVLGQVEAAKRHELSGSRVAIGSLLFLAIHMITGLVVSAALLPWIAPQVFGVYRLPFLLAPALALLLAPSVLTKVIAAVLKVLRRPALPAPLSWSDVMMPSAWMMLTWTMFGLGVASVAEPLAGVASADELVIAGIGTFALAWVVGLLVVPSPAGLGARELALFVVLAPLVDPTGATSIAIILRFIHTIADILLAGAVTLLARN